MKALIKYFDFHYDNHQGASGRSVEGVVSIDVPDDLPCRDFFSYVVGQVRIYALQFRPFTDDHLPDPTISSLQVVA